MPGIQLILILLANNGILIYQGQAKPLRNLKENNKELLNEFFIGISTINLMLYTDFCPDVAFKYLSGYVFIFIVMLTIGFNLFGVVS